MSDDSPNDPGYPVDPHSSVEWIDEIATAEGVDRTEIVERLVSSYWTLKEMHGLMEQTGGDIDLDSQNSPPNLEGLFSESVSSDIANIEKRLSRLENQADEEPAQLPVLRGELDMLIERIDGIERSLSGRQSEIEQRFNEEIANLEHILDYLIDTTDALENALESFGDAQTIDRGWLEQRKVLSELKDLAGRLGVRKAKCEHCEVSVDIALLAAPECPKCQRKFRDIDPDKRWLGLGSNTLRIAGGFDLEETSQGMEEHGRPTRVDSDTHSKDRFHWGEDRN